MPTIGEMTNELMALSKKPGWAKQSYPEQTQAIKQVLGMSEHFGSLDDAGKAYEVTKVQRAMGINTPEASSIGNVAQGMLEYGGPAIGGTIGTIYGGMPGGVAGAVVPGQIAEYTRPALTGEPVRSIEEQTMARTLDAVGEAIPYLAGAGYRASKSLIKGTSNQITAAMRRWLKAGGAAADALEMPVGEAGTKFGKRVRKAIKRGARVTPESESAQRVFDEYGVEQYAFQRFRPGDPTGMATLAEEMAASTALGPASLDKVTRQQMGAAEAYLQDMGMEFATKGDGPSLVKVMKGVLNDRINFARGIEKGMYSQLDQMTGGVSVNISPVLERTAKDYGDISQIREVLQGVMPEAYRKTSATGRADAIFKLSQKQARAQLSKEQAQLTNLLKQKQARKVARMTVEEADALDLAIAQQQETVLDMRAVAQGKTSVAQSESAALFAEEIEEATGPTTLSIKGAMSRISKLRQMAREATGPNARRVKDVSNAMANQLEEQINKVIPEEAAVMWDVARNFTRESREILGNKAATNFLYNMSQETPDKFLEVALGRDSSDYMLKLKNAMTKPLPGTTALEPGLAASINAWNDSVVPMIHQSLMKEGSNGLGRSIYEMSGEKMKGSLRNLSKQQMNTILGQGFHENYTAVADAIDIAARRPRDSIRIAFRAVQYGGAAAVATGVATMPNEDKTWTESIVQGVGTGAVLLTLPEAWSKYILDPTFGRSFARALKTGSKSKVVEVLKRMAARGGAELTMREKLEETIGQLQEVKRTQPFFRGAGLIFDPNVRRDRR